MRVLKCQRRDDATPDAPVRSTFDSRYLLNRMLNAAAGSGDVEKVAALGIQKTLVAVKSYGHYASVLAHLAEEAFNNTVAEHGRLEESWRKTEEDLRACQADKDRLMGDLQKLDAEKVRLEGRVLDLTEEKKRLAADLEKATRDLEKARDEVERSRGELKRVLDLFPDLTAGSDLFQAVDDLKASAAQEFDNGFEATLAQLKVMYPDADVDRFDVDKVAINGKIVDQEAPTTNAALVVDLSAPDILLNTLLSDDDGTGHAGGAGGDAAGRVAADARVDPEQTP